MGGGGFTMEPENPALDEYVLTLAARQVPRVLLLPTASGDASEQTARFHAAFADRGCELDVLELFKLGARGPVDLRELILGQDIVYVGGGSMQNLIAIWKVHGLDVILREAWQAGVVLAGLSAGAMCWFAQGVTKSTGEPDGADGLGFLPGSFSVHADGEPERLPVYERLVASGELAGGYAADDGVGLLFHGADLDGAVSSRPGARAWRVDADGAGGVIKTPLLVRYLGVSTPEQLRTIPGDVLEFRRARYGATLRES